MFVTNVCSASTASCSRPEFGDLGEDPQLRDRERAELDLEADHPRERGVNCPGDRALALILGDSGGERAEDFQQERPGAHGGVDERYRRGSPSRR